MHEQPSTPSPTDTQPTNSAPSAMGQPNSGGMGRFVAVLMPAIVLGLFAVLVLYGSFGANNPPENWEPPPGSPRRLTTTPLGPPGGLSGGRVAPTRARPMRIVSCALAADEMLLELVGRERLIGITKLALDPDMSFIAEQVADWPADKLIANLEVQAAEKVASWKPDLIVVASWSREFNEKMRQARVPMVELRTTVTIADVRANLEKLAVAVDEAERGEKLLRDFDARLRAVAARTHAIEAPAARPRAIFLAPAGNEISTYGSAHTFHECLQAAGFANVAADDFSLKSFSFVTPPQLLELDARKPVDVVVLPTTQTSGPGTSADPAVALREFPGLSRLAPFSADPPRVIYVPRKHTDTVSHHMIRAIEFLADANPALASPR